MLEVREAVALRVDHRAGTKHARDAPGRAICGRSEGSARRGSAELIATKMNVRDVVYR